MSTAGLSLELITSNPTKPTHVKDEENQIQRPDLILSPTSNLVSPLHLPEDYPILTLPPILHIPQLESIFPYHIPQPTIKNPFDPIGHFKPTNKFTIGLMNVIAEWSKPVMSHQILKAFDAEDKHGEDISIAFRRKMLDMAKGGRRIEVGLIRIIPNEEEGWKFWELDKMSKKTIIGLINRDQEGKVERITLIRQFEDCDSRHVYFEELTYKGQVQEVQIGESYKSKEKICAEEIIESDDDELRIFKEVSNSFIGLNNLLVEEGRTFVKYLQFQIEDEMGLKMRLLLTVCDGLKGHYLGNGNNKDDLVVVAGMKGLVLLA